MSTQTENTDTQDKVSVKEVHELIAIIEEVAKGNYSNDIMEFTKPGHSEMIQRIAEATGMMMLKVEIRELHLEQLIENLRDLNSQMKKNITQTVITIAHALGARDGYTEGHTGRVAIYSERLARRLGLPEEDLKNIKIGGMLHDIGKIGFSDRMFSDQDVSFSKEMVREISQHPEIGESILKDIDFLGPVLDYVRCHHESIDGTGYPDGLKDAEIPLGAKIISVADCFDAIFTDRSYKKGRTQEETFAILKELSGKDLSSEIVESFIQEIQENGFVV